MNNQFSDQFRAKCIFNKPALINWLKAIYWEDLYDAMENLRFVDDDIEQTNDKETYDRAVHLIICGHLDYQTVIEIAAWYKADLPALPQF